MAVILKTVALGASRRERQDRVETIQRLNGCLFIDAEYRGMVRRTKVETNNFGSLGLKLRIVAGHIAFQPVRFQASVLLTRSVAASFRQLQWVEPSLGFLRVAARILACRAGVSTLAVCPGCKVSRPSSPCRRNATSSE